MASSPVVHRRFVRLTPAAVAAKSSKISPAQRAATINLLRQRQQAFLEHQQHGHQPRGTATASATSTTTTSTATSAAAKSRLDELRSRSTCLDARVEAVLMAGGPLNTSRTSDGESPTGHVQSPGLLSPASSVVSSIAPEGVINSRNEVDVDAIDLTGQLGKPQELAVEESIEAAFMADDDLSIAGSSLDGDEEEEEEDEEGEEEEEEAADSVNNSNSNNNSSDNNNSDSSSSRVVEKTPTSSSASRFARLKSRREQRQNRSPSSTDGTEAQATAAPPPPPPPASTMPPNQPHAAPVSPAPPPPPPPAPLSRMLARLNARKQRRVQPVEAVPAAPVPAPAPAPAPPPAPATPAAPAPAPAPEGEEEEGASASDSDDSDMPSVDHELGARQRGLLFATLAAAKRLKGGAAGSSNSVQSAAEQFEAIASAVGEEKGDDSDQAGAHESDSDSDSDLPTVSNATLSNAQQRLRDMTTVASIPSSMQPPPSAGLQYATATATAAAATTAASEPLRTYPSPAAMVDALMARVWGGEAAAAHASPSRAETAQRRTLASRYAMPVQGTHKQRPAAARTKRQYQAQPQAQPQAQAQQYRAPPRSPAVATDTDSYYRRTAPPRSSHRQGSSRRTNPVSVDRAMHRPVPAPPPVVIKTPPRSGTTRAGAGVGGGVGVGGGGGGGRQQGGVNGVPIDLTAGRRDPAAQAADLAALIEARWRATLSSSSTPLQY